ncbi:raffinose/stachyose/melibiose transport system substrate-binding protein [Evansella caseinilytica]|uniref:Raffinose/stachyose/melibiose transport system substrate-binding protein n=1 Tax=Evansella caseinilytica TaxID=1503961 RepID=A0A1H3ISV1_9BACI|nr:extracellular solute-binding protein [Evansella caseinilytica]SDY30802.1 raffinose/stachyose/melibiose transport system substrate-binding protein [Evansella caseinilytica]
MKKCFAGLLTSALAVSLLAGCGGSGNNAEDDQITLEFFQFKQEAVGTFDELIEKFEAQNPDINITQNNVPESDTVLLSRLTQNDVPEIMAINGNSTYGELARAGALKDFSGDENVSRVIPSYIEMLAMIVTSDEETNGIPHSANANTVLYNKTKFAELGLEVPTTWDELIAAAEAIEAAGEVPFYSAYGDSWTVLPPFNALASNLHGDDFFEKRHANETTFAERYREVAEKMLKLLEYTDNDVFGANYNQGNTAFANGESVMYMQGVWAIGPIKEANPDMEIGAFALPATNNAGENRLISGVDVVLTISADAKHPEEAQRFVDFLLEEENLQYYIDQQRLFSAIENVYQEDPSVVDLLTHFEEGTITSFADHYYLQGMQVDNLVQEFLVNEDVDKFLKTIDDEWDKVKARQ